MLLGRTLRSPQHGAHASQQFIHTERLAERVIGSQSEATHLVLILPTGRHNENRHGSELAHTGADGKAIHFGHHAVEQHEVRRMALDAFKGLLAITAFRLLVMQVAGSLE